MWVLGSRILAQYSIQPGNRCSGLRGDLLNSLGPLGCSLEPPTPTFASAIKCHQKSTSNSAGSPVGSLAPPRATPRLGGVYVSCQYLPCSFVLALRELGLRLGVKASQRPPPFLHVPPRALWLECGPVEKKKRPPPSRQRATWLAACRRREKRPSSSTRQANKVGRRMSRRASRI
jgi:hypothetical protein